MELCVCVLGKTRKCWCPGLGWVGDMNTSQGPSPVPGAPPETA